MRKIERNGGNAPGPKGRGCQYLAGCGPQEKPRKMDDNNHAVRSAGCAVGEGCTMIDYYDLLMEQNERA